ncbi:glycosyl transferase family 2 [Micromonospora pisi]|uniref:Glycosyl transferase family 2 n=1 Tax=Micromonospora pisi TaxID=589240 RepID=A0A495JWZ8_9ACTN|nr:glycosyltransferase [Micromonospora pisi]RKR92784.1 glycosyl transferase family 2 [Micromonospora pisi]
MSIALLVITDGRDDYLAQCISSLDALEGPISERWMYDDTGNAAYRARLAAVWPEFRHINGGPRQGFGGAIRAAWSHLAAHSTADWLFHIEQDFTFHRPVDLAAMAEVLTERPHLVQMALRRQSWNTAERAAGGVVEQHPEAYTACHDDHGHQWLEHRQFFTTNPCLYRTELLQVGWPDREQSEGHFTNRLLSSGLGTVPGDQVRFGYWGARSDSPWVEHVGHQRIGVGY